MGALLNVVLICCVSSLLILSFTGTAGAGLYLAGSKEKTEALEQEQIDAYMKEFNDKLEDELEAYDDPRSYSFKTRKESTEGFGQLPYFPTAAYYRRRPTESAILWEYRSDVLPNSGPQSYSIKDTGGGTYSALDNINESPTSIKWQNQGKEVWTQLFDKDSLKIDCGNDALNSFQIRSDKKSKTREVIKPKTDEVTGTTLNYKHQFISYHDNYKQLYKCLTGSEGWGWNLDERVVASGETDNSISSEQTLERDGVKPDGNQNKIMDCDYKAIGSSEFGEEGAAKEFPISMIEPIWDDAIIEKNFPINSSSNSPMTTDYYLDPKYMNFKYKCLKRGVFGPCKDMKYTEWVPFLASQGEGPRELRHSMAHNFFSKTSGEVQAPAKLKNLLNPTVDPVKGLGRVKCHPTEVLTRLDFEVSEGLDAPKDYVRWGYRCCKM
jgi:hypothetical protein